MESGLVVFASRIQPFECVDERRKSVQGRRLLAGCGEYSSRLVGLVDLRVTQHLDDLHRASSLHRPVQRLLQEEPSAFLRPFDTLTNPGTEQAVAAPQVVIEEAERRPDREGVQPQRHFRRLDRHRILVHAVHASLQHHAPDHMTVVELLGPGWSSPARRRCEGPCRERCRCPPRAVRHTPPAHPPLRPWRQSPDPPGNPRSRPGSDPDPMAGSQTLRSSGLLAGSRRFSSVSLNRRRRRLLRSFSVSVAKASSRARTSGPIVSSRIRPTSSSGV